jgi:transcriptional regulator with XRE-family HTH domain
MKDFDFYIKLGSIIRKQRKKQGITLIEISRVADTSSQQFSKYETGINRIPVDRLEKVSEILDLSFDTLIRNAREI